MEFRPVFVLVSLVLILLFARWGWVEANRLEERTHKTHGRTFSEVLPPPSEEGGP